MGCARSDPPADGAEGVLVAAQDSAAEPAAVVAVATSEPVYEAADLVGVWLLEDLGGRGVMDRVQTTIAFDAEGRVAGSGGCNRFTGSYTFEDGRLAFGPMAGTKMMCAEAVMDQEDRFHDALADLERITIDGDSLLIEITGSAAPLRFTRMESDVID